MQDYDWNDLRVVLALYRAGTFADAGLRVGSNETTIARRIRTLETQLGMAVFRKNSAGLQVVTDAGARIVARAEIIERENFALQEDIGRMSSRLSGVVRISAVPFIANRFLVSRLGQLNAQHPDVTIELVPEARNVDLTRREADLAIRLARPLGGGLQTMARRIGDLEFAVFGPGPLSDQECRSLSWIGYDDDHSGLPQARWLRTIMNGPKQRQSFLKVADLETAIEAVAGGLGKSVLPRCVADTDPRLCRLPGPVAPPLPLRDVWLLSHSDHLARAAIAAVKDWLVGLSWR